MTSTTPVSMTEQTDINREQIVYMWEALIPVHRTSSKALTVKDATATKARPQTKDILSDDVLFTRNYGEGISPAPNKPSRKGFWNSTSASDRLEAA